MTDERIETTPALPLGFPGLKGSLGLFVLIVVVLITLEVFVEILARRSASIESIRFDLAIVLPQVAVALVLAWHLPRVGLGWGEVLAFRPLPLPQVVPLLVSMAGTFAFVTGLLGMLELVFGSPDELNARFEELFEKSNPWVRALAAAVLAPLGEEIFFRGLLLRGLLERHRVVTAIVVSSVLFGVLHVHPYRFIVATVLGLHLGWWFSRTGNLTPCVVAHSFVNFTVGVLLPEVASPEALERWEDVAGWGDVAAVLALGAVVALVGLRWAARVTRS